MMSSLFMTASSLEDHLSPVSSLLLKAWASITMWSTYMGDLLSNAVIFNHLAWVRFCLQNGAVSSALALAARHGGQISSK